MLYVNFSLNSLKLVPIWPAYFGSHFVTEATVKVKPISYLYTWAIVQLHAYNNKMKLLKAFFFFFFFFGGGGERWGRDKIPSIYVDLFHLSFDTTGIRNHHFLKLGYEQLVLSGM